MSETLTVHVEWDSDTETIGIRKGDLGWVPLDTPSLITAIAESGGPSSSRSWMGDGAEDPGMTRAYREGWDDCIAAIKRAHGA